MTFIFVALLLLHSLRKLIGSAAFYIAVGLLLVFTQVVGATELRVITGYPGADFYIASSVLFLPYLTLLLVVYVTEGTLQAQRLIIGAMATLGLYIYLSQLTALQCNWPGYAISQGPSADSLDYLLRQSQRTMSASILAQALDLFLIPIFFQRLRNLNCRMFFCVVGSLMLTQLVDNFVFVTACYWGQPQWWLYMNSSYIAKAVATIWLSAVTALYLSRIKEEVPGESRRALDIVFAFFAGYGKAQALQQNLREWEGRYRMLVENASDMILVLNEAGVILDCNEAAVRTMRLHSRTELLNRAFPELLFSEDGQSFPWKHCLDSNRVEDTHAGHCIHKFACFADAHGEKVELDIVTTDINAEGLPMQIVFGRDVTEQKRMAREHEELRSQLAHNQRLESIGKLAGGVAHDFNNHIHAIQGHLDLIRYMHDISDEKILHHLDKIDQIATQSSKLTQQLLGFARKGAYVVKVIDLASLVQQSTELFMPGSQAGIELKTRIPGRKLPVKGDPVQLQQVILNLLINARDAMEANQGHRLLSVSVDEASLFPDDWYPPAHKTQLMELVRSPHDYFCVKVADNGEGIASKNMGKLFEPFFTTKPVGKGTGMGLAMAYGAITSHGGWIHVESEPGHGATFYIYLPKATPDAA